MIEYALPLTSRPRSRTRTMQAMVWQQEGCAAEAMVPIPQLRAQEVLIRASGYGLSLHDFRTWRRGTPLVPGAPSAEGWGVVARVGSGVTGLEPGQPVAFITPRGFAEYALADYRRVIPLPAALADGPFLLRSLGGVVHLFRRSCIEPGDHVAIVGGGFVGLATAQLIALAEAETLVISRREISRVTALKLGVRAALPTDEALLSRVHRFTDRKLCDFVIEAAGTAPALQLAGELTRPRGRLVIAGDHPAPRAVNLPLWSERGLDVINAHEPSPTLNLECLREAVSAVAAGLITPGVLYTHRFPLGRINEALQCANRRGEGYLKALIHLSPCTKPPTHPLRPRVF